MIVCRSPTPKVKMPQRITRIAVRADCCTFLRDQWMRVLLLSVMSIASKVYGACTRKIRTELSRVFGRMESGVLYFAITFA